jgi:hypothetical protein
MDQNLMRWSFVRALDAGGLVWEEQEDYATFDAALQDLEANLLVRMPQHHL